MIQMRCLQAKQAAPITQPTFPPLPLSICLMPKWWGRISAVLLHLHILKANVSITTK